MSTGFSTDVRDTILARDGYRCRKCGSTSLLELHHRRSRGAGGTSKASINQPANGVTVCGSCHRWAEKERAAAYETGWAIRRSDARPDSEIPLIDVEGNAWLLDDYGNVTLGDMHV